MLVILSPARNNRPASWPDVPTGGHSFVQETAELVRALQGYSPWQLESLLDVPPERGLALYDAYQGFGDAPLYPALLSYYGAAYRNMQPESFTRDELAFAHGHLRILSALYGMLRGLDGITVHRLGLKKDFRPGGLTLHKFWGDTLYKALYAGGDLVVNLASQEYAKLITPYMAPGDRMLTCRFLVDKPGGSRGTVSTVRAARGLMGRFIVTNRITDPKNLRDFSQDNYEYIPSRSCETEYVFVKRRQWDA